MKPRSGIGAWRLARARKRAANIDQGDQELAAPRSATARQPPMLADSEARRCFLFGTWRSAVAELVGNSRSQQLAAGQPSDDQLGENFFLRLERDSISFVFVAIIELTIGRTYSGTKGRQACCH